MFGMHPNAEIGYLTTQCDTLFSTILEVQGGTGGGVRAGAEEAMLATLKDFKDRTPSNFNMITINERIKDKNPFVVVALQECERMNGLLGEIKTTLEDLQLGLSGALNMTDAMEKLGQSLEFNRVPANWDEKAYFSKKSLTPWF